MVALMGDAAFLVPLGSGAAFGFTRVLGLRPASPLTEKQARSGTEEGCGKRKGKCAQQGKMCTALCR